MISSFLTRRFCDASTAQVETIAGPIQRTHALTERKRAACTDRAKARSMASFCFPSLIDVPFL